ncbi:xanthine dehydrogenase small subunit [Kistimonas asteriae]|uniref:xanthine dehydrogenase small subunit n=1 Tax=Kistimonas asteriae TaxID=517724 RepID=UPI001BAC1E9F
MIRFHLNGQWLEESADPSMTVLRYLRTRQTLCAAKEGCASGDCGACCVIMVDQDEQGALHYKAINSCIALLASLDGKGLITVEGLSHDDQLHPVQQAIVDCHASQCGFCTPGIVASLAALYHSKEGKAANDDEILVALSGNLCRCTGYRPILDAARTMHQYPPPPESAPITQLKQLLKQTQWSTPARSDDSAENRKHRLFLPETEHQLQALLADYPDACLWAGGTDLGLTITQSMETADPLICLHRVRNLYRITDDGNTVQFGAMVTYSQAEPWLNACFPAFGRILPRIGSRQIRNLGTLGGNVANGSPIGDTLPVFLALDAQVRLVSAGGTRELAIETFFTGYRQTALRPGEYLQTIIVPKLSTEQWFTVYKVSKRREDDISTVLMALRLDIDDSIIQNARIACGGMAATPLRARRTEAALTGQPLMLASFEQAATRIPRDFTPMDDVRATAAYRLRVAANLVIRAGLEITGTSP